MSNMFTATMPIWIGVLIIVPLFLLALTGFTGWWKCEEKDRSAYWEMDKALADARSQRDKLNTENAQLIVRQENERKTVNGIMAARENELKHLDAQKADLLEALQEAQAEIKALNMRTIEVPEVAPEPEQVARYQSVLDAAKPVKRTRKKAGAQ